MAGTRRQIEIRRVDAFHGSFFEDHAGNGYAVGLFRSAEVVNWMLNVKWVTTDPQEATAGYHFQDYAPLFEFVVVEIYGRSNHEYKGIAVLRVDENVDDATRTLTVLDTHFADPGNATLLLCVAIEQGRHFRVDRIKLPRACQSVVSRSRILRRLFQQAQRANFYHFSDRRSSCLDQFEPQLADGDTGFA